MIFLRLSQPNHPIAGDATLAPRSRQHYERVHPTAKSAFIVMPVTAALASAGDICRSRRHGEKLMSKHQQASVDEKTTNQGELHEKDLEQITGGNGGNGVRVDPYKNFHFHIQ
jgi:hypothetical protein